MTGRQKDRKTERQQDSKTARQQDRKIGRQEGWKTERQKDWKTGRQKKMKIKVSGFLENLINIRLHSGVGLFFFCTLLFFYLK